MAAVFIVLYTNMAAVTSGENDLLRKKPEKNLGLGRDLNQWPRDTGAMF